MIVIIWAVSLSSWWFRTNLSSTTFWRKLAAMSKSCSYHDEQLSEFDWPSYQVFSEMDNHRLLEPEKWSNCSAQAIEMFSPLWRWLWLSDRSSENNERIISVDFFAKNQRINLRSTLHRKNNWRPLRLTALQFAGLWHCHLELLTLSPCSLYFVIRRELPSRLVLFRHSHCHKA